jgi:hypothetical protein
MTTTNLRNLNFVIGDKFIAYPNILPDMRECKPMLNLLLFLGLLPAGNGSAASCEEVFSHALSLNEAYKSAVSAGGQRVFGLEAEKYFNTVLIKEISGCVTRASAHSDPTLSKLLFELAYSYSGAADGVIACELARLCLLDPAMARAILLDYEKSKRYELIKVLKRGLENLVGDKSGWASHMKELSQLLKELDSE